MSTEYYDKLKLKYPLNRLENEFEKIEKLGYTVVTSPDQCLIWLRNELIIDSDFSTDFHENAAAAIESFWHKYERE